MEDINYAQKYVLVEKVKQRFGENLLGKTFAVWGLTFKPDTDGMRESAAISIVERLTEAGSAIQAYDLKGMETARTIYLKNYTNITYCESKYEAL